MIFIVFYFDTYNLTSETCNLKILIIKDALPCFSTVFFESETCPEATGLLPN